MANFVQILLDRGRADELGAITDAFAARVAAAEGRLRVRIRTAIPLPADLRERLVAQLSERVGRAIDVDTVVDEEIMGGVVIETDGSVVDASVRTRLGRPACIDAARSGARRGCRRQRLNRPTRKGRRDR